MSLLTTLTASESTLVKVELIIAFLLHHVKVFGETTPSGTVAVQVREKV